VSPTNNAAVVEHVLTADLHRVTELARAVPLIDFRRHEAVEAIENVVDFRPVGPDQRDRCRQLVERIDTSPLVFT